MQTNIHIRYYSPFPVTIPDLWVDRVRVTHPSATRQHPEGPVTVRLACIKPPASVHPEPGSNSPLYCCSYIYTPESEDSSEILSRVVWSIPDSLTSKKFAFVIEISNYYKLGFLPLISPNLSKNFSSKAVANIQTYFSINQIYLKIFFSCRYHEKDNQYTKKFFTRKILR